MDNKPFQFKEFQLYHSRSALKIGTDSVLLASAIPIQKPTTILDIGTGCGVILFCIAARNKSQTSQLQFYTGVDIDGPSIQEAQLNKSHFPVNKNQFFRFIQSSIQEFAIENMEYDLIVSNPPFFGNSLASPHKRNQLSKHRDENLSFEDLAVSVASLLSEKGVFYLILPVQEMAQFDVICSDKGLYPCYQMNVYPIQGKPMHRIIKGYCKQNPAPFEILNLNIRETPSEYSTEYKELTKQFYLNF
jgi:tRNA1Val (adenine37-N6)-methyltransferase